MHRWLRVPEPKHGAVPDAPDELAVAAPSSAPEPERAEWRVAEVRQPGPHLDKGQRGKGVHIAEAEANREADVGAED